MAYNRTLRKEASRYFLSFEFVVYLQMKISIHQPSWWFSLCGHSPLFLAMRQTHKIDNYQLPTNYRLGSSEIL